MSHYLHLKKVLKKCLLHLPQTTIALLDKGEKVKQTVWHNLVAWGKTAELMSEILTKGNEIAVQGKLISRAYEDKEGVKRYITEVKVNEFYKLTKTA
jgi:single stranded DNA-binding protein